MKPRSGSKIFELEVILSPATSVTTTRRVDTLLGLATELVVIYFVFSVILSPLVDFITSQDFVTELLCTVHTYFDKKTVASK